MANRRRGVRAAGAGLLAALAALGGGELVAGLLRPQASPVAVVGATVIDLTPTPVKEFAVSTFGSHDKAVLVGTIVLVLLGFACLLGLLAGAGRRALAATGVAGLGLVGTAAAATRPATVPVDAVPSLVAAIVGALTLLALVPAVPPTGGARILPTRGRRAIPVNTRRAFLVTGTGAAAAITTGRLLASRAPAGTLLLPPPAAPAPPLPAGTDLRVPGLGPFVTPAADFYRVDTALVVPRLLLDDWTLRVHGTRTIELTMADVLRRGLIERDITLTCVSNEVGGPYVGNARWLGAPLAPLLREAGIPAGSDQLLSRSADGWTAGTPVDVVMDGRDAMLAVGMNGRALPAERGFPARLVVPGLYGYVSATKWVVELRLTRYADEHAYWTERGWAVDAPVKTMSRIDVPAPFGRLRAGAVTVAGVAWAQHRGVAGVEVRVDGGPWQEARLAAVPGPDTWRQWAWTWQATPGGHTVEVRATDAAGHTQQSSRVTPFPDGATGWHSVAVTVT
ncbi:molybdopterin-dependent oxidoreductase [Streptosporangium sp. NPDC051023]|uniref:molybdopterin-dependent oxidoreductase n=1 Tax=Streptosporangium sp. NPDC051023 TaxID=3155410 RepID=UPI00344C4698